MDKPQATQGWLEFGDDFARPEGEPEVVRRRRSHGRGKAETPPDATSRDDPVFNAELLRSLLMSTGEGIYGIDRQGRCTFCNPSAVKLLGFPSAEEAIGQPIHELTHCRQAEGSAARPDACRILQAMEDRQGVHVEDERFWRRDGTSFPAEYRAQPVFRDGEVVGAVVSFADITERKRAEEAMRASEARFRSLFEQTSVGTAIFDPDGRYTAVNKAFCDLLGYSEEELLGLTYEDITFDEDREASVDRNRRVRAGEIDRFNAEKRYVRKDGTPIWVALSGSTIRDSEGVPVLNVRQVQDITAKNRAMEAVRESEARFRAFIDNSAAAINLKDGDGRYLLVNRTFARWFEVDDEDVRGKTVHDMFPPELAKINGAVDQEVLKSGTSCEFETETPFADGTMHAVLVVKFPLRNAEGKVCGVGTISTDITARKRAEDALREREEQLRAVIENSPAAICLRDTEGRCVLFNREFERRHGVALEKARGKLFDGLLAPDVAQIIAMNDEVVLDTEEPCEYEVEFPDAYNVMRMGFTNKFPIFGHQGVVVGIGSICADMTDHKQMEEKLRHAQKLEAVGQLTGGVAHDFNNILAVILTNLEFLEEDLGLSDESHREIISEAIRAVHRGAKLTERLLAFSRKQPLNPKAIDLVGILSEMVELLRRTLGETITVQTEFPGNLYPVFVDRNQLENAVLNLAVNARDAMKRGGKLEILCTNKKVVHRASGRINEMPSGQYVCIEIRDNGEGMPPEVIERAFEPFFTTKKTGEGSGLGLSMVYGFANQSGGAVTISSAVGEGTSVKLFLPAVPPDRKGAVIEADDAEETVLAGLPRGGETVLVVEDDADVGSSARRTLTSLGYQVLFASNAIDALKMLKKNRRVDLLFSDVIMPGGLDGRELAEEARNLLPDLKIVLTSGYAAGKLNRLELDVAGIGFIPKPYTRRTLAETVREIFDRAKAH